MGARGGFLGISSEAGWPTLEVGWSSGEWTRHAILFHPCTIWEYESAVRQHGFDVDQAADQLVEKYGGYSIFQYITKDPDCLVFTL